MTIINRFGGDPKWILGPDGADLVYKSGQPVMDQGVENQIFCDLFFKKKGTTRNQNGWWGNLLTDDPLEQYGSDYVDTTANQPITINTLSNNDKAAKKALVDPVYGNIESTSSNPESDRIDSEITVSSPNLKILIETQNASNWKAQAVSPASGNI